MTKQGLRMRQLKKEGRCVSCAKLNEGPNCLCLECGKKHLKSGIIKKRQLKKEGRCVQCRGVNDGPYSWFCLKCRKRATVMQRLLLDVKPWKKGGPGRPPIIR